MPTLVTKQTVIPLWRYRCPECNVSDSETGHTAVDHAIYCEVCLEEGSYVRLARWPED